MTCLPRLTLLTDRRQLPVGRELVATLVRCVTAGARLVVVRELDLDDRARGDLVRALGDALTAGSAGADVLVLSARRRLPGTAGVHLAAHQAAHQVAHQAAQAPDRLRAAGWVGRSCHDVTEVRAATAAGADYVTTSPVAVTSSKPGHGPALGPDGLARLVHEAGGTPAYALGGVSADNAADWLAAGAHGVAVMGAVMRADDPGLVVARLCEEVA